MTKVAMVCPSVQDEHQSAAIQTSLELVAYLVESAAINTKRHGLRKLKRI